MDTLRRMLYTYLSFLLLTANTCLVHANRSGVHTISSFPNGTWLENLAVRPNGNVLVTLIGVPEVWEIDITKTKNNKKLVYRFSEVNSAFGIAEYATDVYGINVGNISLATNTATPKSWSVWSLDLTGGIHKPKAKKITDIPPAMLLNGMASLPANPERLLTADSIAGKIYFVDTKAKEYGVVSSASALKPNASAVPPIGVNGIQFRPHDPDHLYFSNPTSPAFSRIRIHPEGGGQIGPVQAIEKPPIYHGDDFTFDASGKYAYIAEGPVQTLLKLDISKGRAKQVVGGLFSNALPGSTSCKFGRTKEDVAKGRLYITTNGGLSGAPRSGIITGGKLFAVDTKKNS